MPTIQLDIAGDCDHHALTKDMGKRLGLKVTLVKLVGPAGGNPLYQFEGTKEDLEALVREYDGDNGDYDYLVTLIEE